MMSSSRTLIVNSKKMVCAIFFALQLILYFRLFLCLARNHVHLVHLERGKVEIGLTEH